MEFDSMIFYRSWMEAVDKLDTATQGEVYRAIVVYGLNGEIPEDLSPLSQAMLTMAKPNIDANNAKRKASVENGQKGGRPKAKANQKETKQNPNKTQTKPNDNLTETQTKPNETQSKPLLLMDNGELLIDNNNINHCPPKSASEARFDIFWQTYPRKAKKKDAEKAWKKINPDKDLFDKIIKAVSDWRFSEQWTKDGGQYIPYPATWLNGGQWEDEIPKVRAPVKKNQFSNFPQRGYTETDYKELERKMLTERRRTG